MRSGKRNKLVFFGIMDYEPNILAVEYIIKNVLPQLNEKYKIEIVGPKVSTKLKKLENSRLKFCGYVESVKEKLKEEDIFICPIIAGSGVKNKILQAGRVGLPIVCTDLSLEGINNEIKEVAYIANNGKEFIQKIEEINNTDTKELEKRLEKQKEIIEKYNSMEMIGKILK